MTAKTAAAISSFVVALGSAGCLNFYEIAVETPIQAKLDVTPFQRVLVAGFLGGGSKTYIADATGIDSVFQLKGNLNGGGGGSCLMIGAAADHDINGNVLAAGAIVLGAGIYSVDGYVAFGANGGGGGGCPDTSISVEGIDVSLIISGKTTANQGSCVGFAFCIALLNAIEPAILKAISLESTSW